MWRLAVSNLVQDNVRLLISVGGVALALTLVLFFDAVFAGAQGRLTAYIDHAGADVWVSQQGVRTMHMSASALPASVTDQVRAVPGVGEAVPILYAEDMVRAKGKEYIAYVFGVPDGAPFGGPWRIVAGAAAPGPGEVIIDRAIATQAGLRVGDRVTVLGQQMRIAGLTSGTSSLVSAATFVRMDDFARVRGGGAVVSFVLVKVQPGESPSVVAARLAQRVSGVTVQTREQFAAQERKLVGDMSADIITIMNTAGFLTGLAVIALTMYIATLGRRKEYGVLKAIGVRNGRLYQIVVLQALLSVGLGLIAGLGLTLLLGVLIPRVNEFIVLSVSTASVVRVTVVSAAIAGVAALLPARQLAGLEPVAVIRRG
ncbi:MAG: FtsX-like permease family protein [Chloroflexota bacterium]|nr:FtsX-like permease family protein [Chloroflexota bacterium]